MPRIDAMIDGGGDSFYTAVSEVRAAANPQTVRQAEPRAARTDAQMDRDAGVSRTAPRGAVVADEGERARERRFAAAAPAATTPAATTPVKTDAQMDREAGVPRGAAPIVDEQTKAQQKAAQAPKTEPDLKDDPYYKRDPITGLSPAQVEALQAQRDAAAAKAEAIDEYYSWVS